MTKASQPENICDRFLIKSADGELSVTWCDT